MGQMTVGIMCGAPLPAGVDGYDDDADDGGFLERYAHAIGKYDGREWWERRCRIVPRQSEEQNVCGFFLALDRGGHEYGVGDFNSVPLDEIETRFAEPLRSARERWSTFAAWAKTQGVEMPAARLWLAITEVA